MYSDQNLQLDRGSLGLARGHPSEGGPSTKSFFPFSGRERNRFFVNHAGARFSDGSAISGLDHPADGRAFGILDLDRDGFPDLAVVNANAPLFQLFRNQGDLVVQPGAAHFIALRFRGGNDSARPQGEWSPRDGFGARVEVSAGGRTLIREHRAGEGLAAQNSTTLLVGIGSAVRAERVTVHWPTGRSQTIENVAAGTLLTAHENPASSPSGSPWAKESYGAPR